MEFPTRPPPLPGNLPRLPVRAMTMWIGKCSRAASARLAQQPLPALAGLEFVAMDVAAHDGSLASIRRNFVGGRRRCRRTVRDDRGFRLGEPSRDSIVFGDLRLLAPPLRRFVRRGGAGASGGFSRRGCRLARRNVDRFSRAAPRALSRLTARPKSAAASKVSPSSETAPTAVSAALARTRQAVPGPREMNASTHRRRRGWEESGPWEPREPNRGAVVPAPSLRTPHPRRVACRDRMPFESARSRTVARLRSDWTHASAAAGPRP